MLDAGHPTLTVQAAPGVAVDRLVLGRPVAEVRAVLPRIFSLCRCAQGAAVAAALGEAPDAQGIATEILRDHLLKLFVTWPGFFGCAPHPLPPDWREGGPAVARAVFGPAGRAPETPAAMEAFLTSGQGAAAILARIDDVFARAKPWPKACPRSTAPASATARPARTRLPRATWTSPRCAGSRRAGAGGRSGAPPPDSGTWRRR
ncbi:hypothetical protein [Jannaschia seohaensis]|uniref:hypothetical protein n=1 Tax=Jannaschia seohaensis TaxID=475081 RepID=UPI00158164D6|nr:hypothetical protein [Jannaschia seohaensis]